MHQPLPSDGRAMRRYRESYEYDLVGNILKVIHSAAHGDWTRAYSYGDDALATPASNRLGSTNVGSLTEHYVHDRHGNMLRMPHLVDMEGDFKGQLQSTQRPGVNEGPGERTNY